MKEEERIYISVAIFILFITMIFFYEIIEIDKLWITLK